MNLLLAEDDDVLADALSAQLGAAGFAVERAANGAVAEYLALRQPFDLIVLDLGLPLVDGLTVLRKVRLARPQLPVLILTALDSLDDRVAGLNAGADDYLSKPFDFPELEARLRALLRRTRPAAPAARFGHLVLEQEARRATVQGNALDLSPREWLLLDLLMAQRERVVTKEQILQAWSADRAEGQPANNTVEVHIHRLRKKLEDSGLSIRTVRGLGYLLEAAPAASAG
ncbi:response regulator transcription factor [Ideonella livida]|uniref:Response regulator transcription factor n=1 Tax=Ideonella livida TaxID=2707176 RepID=A0A7C9THJ3_9BURK|nr:response regulator transcription factor [Ideonella livida]NDY90659.1 response regulator transcription factor [Ideonella livida]